MGGGVGKQGEICGALNGGSLALGLLYGRDDPGDKATKTAVNAKVAQLFERFTESNGLIRCRDLTGVSLNTEEGSRLFHERDSHTNVCNGAVSRAVRAVLELVEEESQG